MRGAVRFSPARAEWPKCRGFEAKRLMGFEPTNLRMASRRSSQLSYSRLGLRVL